MDFINFSKIHNFLQFVKIFNFVTLPKVEKYPNLYFSEVQFKNIGNRLFLSIVYKIHRLAFDVFYIMKFIEVVFFDIIIFNFKIFIVQN